LAQARLRRPPHLLLPVRFLPLHARLDFIVKSMPPDRLRYAIQCRQRNARYFRNAKVAMVNGIFRLVRK
jgi:hypothetical protein